MSILNRRVFIFIGLLLLASCDAVNGDDFVIDGTWFIKPKQSLSLSELQSKEFGWGDGLTTPNSFLEIDSIEKTIYIPGLFLMNIVSIKESKP